MGSDDAEEVDYGVETAHWAAQSPSGAASRSLAFVDGVQQIDVPVIDDVAGKQPVEGVMASFAAGAICIGALPFLQHERIGRATIMGPGGELRDRSIPVGGTTLEYRAFPADGQEPADLNARLMELRAQLESQTLGSVRSAGYQAVIYDGRLPPIGPSSVIGLIKNPHLLPFSAYDGNMRLLATLTMGQRTPVLRRRRSQRWFYTWFVCLRTPKIWEYSMSGVVMLEMDSSNSIAEVKEAADYTAVELPRFASDPIDDPRYPQNLLPVGRLERELRHLLGDADLLDREIRDYLRAEV